MQAGSDALSISERKWVANDAYRLGQALCSCDLLTEACQVLELSCHELTVWCKTGEPSAEVQRSRSREAHLLERFYNLCDVYCQNGDYSIAMATIENAITSLPANQIAEQETASLLVDKWVRVKRQLVNESLRLTSDSADLSTSGRSLASALNRVGGVSDDTKILYLNTELTTYQGQRLVCEMASRNSEFISHAHTRTHTHTYRYDTHCGEVSVVQELLGLHSLTDSHSSLLHTARLTTQLSTLCRSCHTHASSDHTPCKSPLSLLDDTVALLEHLITSLTQLHNHTLTRAHQHLATAYLWKAVCTLEQHVR